MVGPGARGSVASRWPDVFGEDRFFEFEEDRYSIRYLCLQTMTFPPRFQ